MIVLDYQLHVRKSKYKTLITTLSYFMLPRKTKIFLILSPLNFFFTIIFGGTIEEIDNRHI